MKRLKGGDRSQLGRIFRRFRMMRGYTMEELSKKAGLSLGACYTIEGRNQGTPRAPNIMKLARALGVPPGIIVQLSAWDELEEHEKDSVNRAVDALMLDGDFRGASERDEKLERIEGMLRELK